MKILAFEYGHNVQTIDETIVCYPDSTLTRNNDDFYYPNFTKELVAYVGVYLQFTKIGKCIEPRFVNRYFSEFGAGIKFMANDVIARNKLLGTATDIARGFDASLAISNEKIPFQCPISIEAKLNGTPLQIDTEQVANISELIATATKYYTIKIGDFFFLPLMHEPIPVSIGDIFDISLSGEQMVTCTIK